MTQNAFLAIVKCLTRAPSHTTTFMHVFMPKSLGNLFTFFDWLKNTLGSCDLQPSLLTPPPPPKKKINGEDSREDCKQRECWI